jgi:signal recognition particle receptor subunit alpha
MTYVTGQPIIFVGCGQVGCRHTGTCTTFLLINVSAVQTYTDLRQLRVANVVSAILGD